jgi:hypothetical protein
MKGCLPVRVEGTNVELAVKEVRGNLKKYNIFKKENCFKIFHLPRTKVNFNSTKNKRLKKLQPDDKQDLLELYGTFDHRAHIGVEMK